MGRLTINKNGKLIGLILKDGRNHNHYNKIIITKANLIK